MQLTVRQQQSLAEGSAAKMSHNKVDKTKITMNLPKEVRPEFAGKNRYHTSWETRAASRPQLSGPMNAPDFIGFGNDRLAISATCRGGDPFALGEERKKRKNPEWMGMLPDWEIQSLFDGLRPDNHTPDPNLFSFYDPKTQQRKPHRLDVFVKMASGASGREQTDIADVLRNAKSGTKRAHAAA